MALLARFVNRQALYGATLLALAGCANPIDQHGNLPEADKLSQITPGTSDKAAVTRLLGSPSSTAAFDPNVWYYISQKKRLVALRPPELLDQEVVAIGFDDKGIVQDVARRTMADRAAIEPNPNATPAPGREFTFLEQLIGNLGKFTGKDKDKNTSSGH
jgi:outer membrane protein assembly factor BamE (lipoprotein component of BamABCDE complex)